MSMSVLAAACKSFGSSFGEPVGPWTLAFAVLVSGYAMREPGVVILEGSPDITSIVAGGVLSMFPEESIHRETAGFRGLFSHITKTKSTSGSTRLLYLPGIDVHKRASVTGMLDDWVDSLGYKHEYIDDVGDRQEANAGFIGVLVTCQSASVLPSCFTNGAWILHPVLSDAQLEVMQDETRPDMTAIQVMVSRLVDRAANMTCNDVYARALIRSLVGTPNERLSQGVRIRRLMRAVTVLGIDDHANPGSVVTDSYTDLTVVRRLLHAARPRSRPLTPGERALYDRVLQLSSVTGNAKKPAPVTFGTTEIYHLMQDLGVTDRTIRNWLATMVSDGLLIKSNDGTKNVYQIAYTVNIDESRLAREVETLGRNIVVSEEMES